MNVGDYVKLVFDDGNKKEDGSYGVIRIGTIIKLDSVFLTLKYPDGGETTIPIARVIRVEKMERGGGGYK